MSIEANIKKIPRWASDTASVTLAEFLCSPINKVESNLLTGGLHMLHYLLGSEDSSHRYMLAMNLSHKFVAHTRASRIINHLFKMSMLDEDFQSSYLNDLRSDRYTDGSKSYSSDTLSHLVTCLAYNQELPDSKDKLINSLSFILQSSYEKSDDAVKHLGCQRLIFALIYNKGYQKLAAKMDVEEVLLQLEPVADAILSLTNLSAIAQAGMKRQIFINLFSHEPAGLRFMNVRAEELQGVPVHDGLLDKDEVRDFSYTLAGPLHLFMNEESRKCLAVPAAVDYFESNGYEIKFQAASSGFLSRDHSIGYLARRDMDSLNYIQNGITGRGPRVDITIALSVSLMKPDVLSRLDDEAKLAVIAHALRYIGKQYEKNPKAPNLSGCKESIAHVVRESPDMIPKIIDMLFENGLLIPKMYEWFGFGQEEMKFVGKRAHAFKGAMLEQDLGM